jgi:hypothetical protein
MIELSWEHKDLTLNEETFTSVAIFFSVQSLNSEKQGVTISSE